MPSRGITLALRPGAIRTYRRAARMTQAELAEKAEVSLMQIYRYESGENNISYSKAQAVAQALACDVNDLVTEN